jgi:hypothetical protein
MLRITKDQEHADYNTKRMADASPSAKSEAASIGGRWRFQSDTFSAFVSSCAEIKAERGPSRWYFSDIPVGLAMSVSGLKRTLLATQADAWK